MKKGRGFSRILENFSRDSAESRPSSQIYPQRRSRPSSRPTVGSEEPDARATKEIPRIARRLEILPTIEP
jgi:hypothetical protein